MSLRNQHAAPGRDLRAILSPTDTWGMAQGSPLVRTPVRPFYFFTVLWGERFRGYFLEYCLASLLAPGNIPSLGPAGHKYLIVTTRDDWAAIDASPIVAKLREYCETVFIEIDYPPAGVHSLVHMGLGHKLATQRCFEDKSYGCLLQPDLMLSDGTVAAMQHHAREGAEVVLLAALRFTEEPLFASLLEQGFDRPGHGRSEAAEPLVLTGRELVGLAMRSVHSETATYDFEKPFFRYMGSAAFWPVPTDGGILLHSFSWCPMLMDYGAVVEHDLHALEKWTIDGDYVYRNFGAANKVHVCTDSDEMMLVSFSPAAHGAVPIIPGKIRTRCPPLRPRINGTILQRTLSSPVFDPLKLELFKRPVYWHISDVDRFWKKKEIKSCEIIRNCFDGKYSFGDDLPIPNFNFRIPGLNFCIRTYKRAVVGILNPPRAVYYRWSHTFRKRIVPALRGERWVWQRIRRRRAKLFSRLRPRSARTVICKAEPFSPPQLSPPLPFNPSE